MSFAPNQQPAALFILDARISRKHEWKELTTERYTREEIDEFFSGLERNESGMFRARMLPQYGHLVLQFHWEPAGGWQDEGKLILARDMPDQVHQLNERILSALGV
jgi:hypothetical protein